MAAASCWNCGQPVHARDQCPWREGDFAPGCCCCDDSQMVKGVAV